MSMVSPKPRSLPPPPPHRSGIRRAPEVAAPPSNALRESVPAAGPALPPPPPLPADDLRGQMAHLQEDLDLIIDASSARLDVVERRLDALAPEDAEAMQEHLRRCEAQIAADAQRIEALEDTLARTRASLRDLTRKMQEIYTETKAYAAAVGQFGAKQRAAEARIEVLELTTTPEEA